MAFADFEPLPPGIALLQRSLARGRLGHAYLFTGDTLGTLEPMALNLVKTLNCLAPPSTSPAGAALDCCDSCDACRRIDGELHPDVRWLRPESKLRVIVVDQMRSLLESVYLKPIEARYKVAILVDADRLNVQAANAFLKTLEEPPDRCVMLLLTVEPQRVLETVRSRCLRLNLGGAAVPVSDPELRDWVVAFAGQAAESRGGLLTRYRLLQLVLTALDARREAIEKSLAARSPVERYPDAEPELREQWEDELAAAVEAGYRRQRAEVLTALHWWLRDVWLLARGVAADRLILPHAAALSERVARRLSPGEALENLAAVERTQRILATNVQEALALEVGLLSLRL